MRRLVLFAVLVSACRPSPVETSAVPSAPASTDAALVVASDDPDDVDPATSPDPSDDDDIEPSDGALVPVAPAEPVVPLVQPTLPEPSGEIRASRIKAGEYECKISREYRFRPCTVTVDEHGRSILTIPMALLAIEGVLTDVGTATRFDGITTRERPFGCFSCQERCSVEPNSCACKELPREHSAECLLQPIRFTFKKKVGQWRGRIEHHLYYGDVDEQGNPVYETNRYVFVMRR